MKLNRREFVAAGSSLLTGIQLLGVKSLAAAPRRLFVSLNGLSVFVLGRQPGTRGFPNETPRVDILFLKNDAHRPATLHTRDGDLDLNMGDLRILVDGQPLRPSGNVKLSQPQLSKECPTTSNEWLSVSRIPVFEEILGESVTLRPECLSQDNPHLVGTRFTMRGGELFGSVPKGYDGAKWTFPGGNSNYIRAFTDVVNWSVPLPPGEIAFELVPFGSKSETKRLVMKSAGEGDDVSVNASSIRIDQTPVETPETTVPHFVHYYDVLQYNKSVRPIPHLYTSRCGAGLSGNAEADCGADVTVVERSDPGICIPGAIFHWPWW